MNTLAPHITEKAIDKIKENKYTFEIDEDLNKKQLAKKIKDLFNVDVVKISILNRLGKTKRTGARIGRRKNIKIAVVTIDKKQKIKEFEAINEQIKSRESNKKTL